MRCLQYTRLLFCLPIKVGAYLLSILSANRINDTAVIISTIISIYSLNSNFKHIGYTNNQTGLCKPNIVRLQLPHLIKKAEITFDSFDKNKLN